MYKHKNYWQADNILGLFNNLCTYQHILLIIIRNKQKSNKKKYYNYLLKAWKCLIFYTEKKKIKEKI